MLSANVSPVIFGCSGLTLSTDEKAFFEIHQPLGFILFKRNIANKDQVKTLVASLKETVQHSNPPILIDQEGGRVARLSSPEWFHPPATTDLVSDDLEASKQRVTNTYSRIAEDLKELGITVNCAPLLDLHVEGADPIMGDRTFSHDPHIVAELGAIAIKAMQEKGIIPVMKHIPGHGAALCDSHEALPIVDLSLEELRPHFIPFQTNASCPWAMTAHIVYSSLDAEHPATCSPFIIQNIIRGEIGFKGALISDDIGMKALSGSFAERAKETLNAGCDVVLHCSGNLDEMRDVMKGIHSLSFDKREAS